MQYAYDKFVARWDFSEKCVRFSRLDLLSVVLVGDLHLPQPHELSDHAVGTLAGPNSRTCQVDHVSWHLAVCRHIAGTTW